MRALARRVGQCVGQLVPRSLFVRRVAWLRAFVLSLGLLLASPIALVTAQDRSGSQHAKRKKKTTRTSRARADTKHRRRPKPEPSAEPPKAPAKENARQERTTDTTASRAAEASAQVDSAVVKEGDTSVKVMRFSGLELEGRLKSPQLLYFVNRVRAEFDRPKLPHRSFMPELERSTKRDPL